MKTLPSVIYSRDDEPTSRGEIKVFELFKRSTFFHHALGLHSLNLIGNERQQMYELDFLLVTQRGFLGIEVKGAKVICKDGIYYIGGSGGYSKRISPYIQASNAIDQFRTNLKRFNLEVYRNSLFAKAAVLTENHRPNEGRRDAPEMPDKAIIYAEDLYDIKRFELALTKAFDFAEEALGKKRSLTRKDIDYVGKRLRPSFDVASCSVSAVDAMLEKQESFTSDQYFWLDVLENMDRALIDGGAGTGKTYLLEQLVKREFDKGRRILICTASEMLSEKIKSDVGHMAITECFPKDVSGDAFKFDMVFVDEGQDLFNADFVDYIDSKLESGLQAGRWRWFADFENQRGVGVKFDQEIFEYIKDATGNSTVFPLRRNVRNTPNIVQWLKQICKARIEETESAGSGPEVKSVKPSAFSTVVSGAEIDSQLGAIEKHKLVHLYLNEDADEYSSVATKAGVPSHSIESFKGLESPFVVITGLGSVNSVSQFQQMAYKAVSRARYLALIVDEGNIVDLKLKAVD